MKVHSATKPPHKSYSVWLDGKFVPFVLAADDEHGWLTCHEVGPDGRFVLTAEGDEIETRARFGEVRIIDQALLPVPCPKFSVETICEIFGVPPYVIPLTNFGAILDAWQRATVEAIFGACGFAKSIRADQLRDEMVAEWWRMGDYVEQACPNCGRHRLCICVNRLHRCEKCNWVPELNNYCYVA